MGVTPKQGEYLASICYYTKLHGRAPAEAEMEKFFRVSPPTVHQMVLTLERAGLISRSPGVARSIRLRVGKDDIPPLD
ncbi:MAG TPA: MarR family transcriptional regulator [Planctomycetota bacterium]|nr:MarR family transcriptional regulator [Planctomycetota bacterium]